MREYFIVADSFAAPFFSDRDTYWQEAETPEAALEALAARYAHPAGLFSALAYEDANAHSKGAEPLARWLSNKARVQMEATEGLGSYSAYSPNQSTIEINGKAIHIDNPRGGRVVPLAKAAPHA